MNEPMTRYQPEIDGLRAMAITPVVLFHAGVPGLRGGYVGVAVFFVLSGFLISPGCRLYGRRHRRTAANSSVGRFPGRAVEGHDQRGRGRDLVEERLFTLHAAAAGTG